jgi:hypothetical protein
VFLIVLVGTVFVAGSAVLAAHGAWQRLVLSGFFFGLWVYCGIGAAYPGVPHYYLVYYFGFLGAFTFAFLLFKAAFAHLSLRSGRALAGGLDNMDSHPVWVLVIWAYLLLHLVPLVYPELRLHDLLDPRAPDLATRWAARWTSQVDVLTKCVEYARVLLTPFFYIALFRYRQRFGRVALSFALLLYLRYAAAGYIGRGSIVMALATIWLALWMVRPRHRRTLVAVAAAVVPLLLVFSYFYAVIRIGGTPGSVTPVQAAARVLESETSFPRDVGVPIIESGARVDLASYARWILTLPIPKLLAGEIEGARVNYEISEVALGLGRYERGWYVVLPGLVAESVYIYGPCFFWLHAVFIALLAALIVRLIERVPQLLFLQAYVVLQFAYILNRAGISGSLAALVNEFMLLYVYIFLRMLVSSALRHPHQSSELSPIALSAGQRKERA